MEKTFKLVPLALCLVMLGGCSDKQEPTPRNTVLTQAKPITCDAEMCKDTLCYYPDEKAIEVWTERDAQGSLIIYSIKNGSGLWSGYAFPQNYPWVICNDASPRELTQLWRKPHE